MYRLNNKGFAISTILYGLLMMASMIMMLLLSTMAFNKKSSDDFVDQVENELNTCIDNGSC